MHVEQIPNDVWMQIIREPNKFAWNFLALKIMLTRLNMRFSMSYYSFDEEQSCNELRMLFKKCVNIPNALKDLQQIQSLIPTSNND